MTDDGPAAARSLVRACRSAALASALTGKRAGWPYASLVTVACDVDASPVLLLSGLADHTRNLAADDRASLLFEAASQLSNPQTGPRVSLTGRLKVSKDEGLARRFLARHPGARRYVGFGDFAFYRMTVERAHFVGGFGRATWFGASKFLFDKEISQAVSGDEASFVDGFNNKYGDGISALARTLFGGNGKSWEITGLDPEGVDFRCRNTFRRHDFAEPVDSIQVLGRNLARLVDIL